MSNNVYLEGDSVDVSATFKNSGTNADPDTVTLTIKDPSGVVTTPTPTNDAVGVYSYTITSVVVGTYYYRWSGDLNSVTAVIEGAFYVQQSSVI